MQELQKCINLLESISKKYELKTSFQLNFPNEKSGFCIYVEKLSTIQFSSCESMIKRQDQIFECIQLKNNIDELQKALDQLIFSMKE